MADNNKSSPEDWPIENRSYKQTRLSVPSWARSSDPWRLVDFTIDLDVKATPGAIGRDVAKWVSDFRKMRRLEKPNLGGNTHVFDDSFRGEIHGWVDCFEAELAAEWDSLCKVVRPAEREKRFAAIIGILHPGRKAKSPARLAETASKTVKDRGRRTVACELLAADLGVAYETIRADDKKQPPPKNWVVVPAES